MSKLIHIDCDGVDEFLLLTPDMSVSEIKEKLFELKGYTDMSSTTDLNPVLTQNGCDIPVEDIDENSPTEPYSLKVLSGADYARYKKVFRAFG